MRLAKVFPSRILAFLSCLLFSAATFHFAAAEQPDVVDVKAFTRSALFDRFDEDADGRLGAAERKQLRSAFGDVDVPMLPDRPYDYTKTALPTYLDEATLREMDNTTPENPLENEVATLGRVLFYDKQLSANDTIACASCHLQQYGFSDPRRFSLGFAGGQTRRNAMGLVNMRYTNLNGGRPGFFWDERAATLEDQVLMPIQDAVEMGMELHELERKLQRLPYYPALFQAAHGSPRVTSQAVAKAVAQFMRAMVSFDAKLDRAAEASGGDLAADFAEFSDEENLGKRLFIQGVGGVGEIGCAHCHVPPTFGMPKSFNTGLDLVYEDRGLGERNVPPNDPLAANNDGKFKAPSLRNVALTAPYMHDGRFETLQQVVAHYSGGVHPHPNLDLAFSEDAPRGEDGVSGFHLTPRRQAALVAFLETLTDETFIADPRFSDPFVRLQD